MHVVAFVSEYTDEWIEKLSELGAEVVTYNLSRGGLNPLADIQSTIQLIYQIKKIGPDLVLSYSAKPVIYGTLAAKAAKVPDIVGMLEGLGYTFTDQPEGQTFKTKLVRNIQVLLYRIAFKFMDKIIFLNIFSTFSLSVSSNKLLIFISLNELFDMLIKSKYDLTNSLLLFL